MSSTVLVVCSSSVMSVALASFLDKTITQSIVASFCCGSIIVGVRKALKASKEDMRIALVGTTAGLGAGVLFDKFVAKTLHLAESAPTLRNTAIAVAVMGLMCLANERIH